jgi:hypothetical protein
LEVNDVRLESRVGHSRIIATLAVFVNRADGSIQWVLGRPSRRDEGVDKDFGFAGIG